MFRNQLALRPLVINPKWAQGNYTVFCFLEYVSTPSFHTHSRFLLKKKNTIFYLVGWTLLSIHFLCDKSILLVPAAGMCYRNTQFLDVILYISSNEICTSSWSISSLHNHSCKSEKNSHQLTSFSIRYA